MKTRFNYARLIRCASLVMTIAAASLAQACSSDTIVAVPSSATSAPTPVPSELRVYGTVTDDKGMPVVGAKVIVHRWTTTGEPRSTVTDSKGFYSVSLQWAGGVAIRTEKAGYESAWHSQSTPRAADFQFDLRIHRIKQ